MVALAPNYRHNVLLAAIAVPSASLALSAVAAFAVVAAVVAVPVHQQLQSDLIGFVLLTSYGDDVEDVMPVVLCRALREGLVPIRAATSSIVPVKVGMTCLGSAIVAIVDVQFCGFASDF
jgi:hypothetical protein